MTLKQVQKFGTQVALLFQVLILCACGVQSTPVTSVFDETPAAAVQLTEPAANPTSTQRQTATTSPATPTADQHTENEPTPSPVSSAPLDGDVLVEALAQGGYVIYFQHAATDMAQSDMPFVDFRDCSTQRNLSEQGRADAFAIGEAFLAFGIPVGQVWNSAYCRSRDTALLAFGRAEASPELTDTQTREREQRIAALQQMLSSLPGAGTNTVIVAEGTNLTDTAGLSLGEGEAAVFAPLSDGFALVARVLPSQWADFLQVASISDESKLAADPNLLLPDLGILPPSNLMIITNADTGNRQLKFTTSIKNDGPGVMEIMGHSDATSEKTIVVQYINAIDGSDKQVVVGEFVYHPDHEHFHFGNFARYEVWSITPDGALETLLSVTDKVSYCLRDDVQIENAEITAAQTYVGCNRARQGITPGWVDVYGFELFGQTIDVSNLPDGIYALLNYVDPDNQLWELDVDNNYSVTFFRLEGSRVNVVDNSEIPCNSINREVKST